MARHKRTSPAAAEKMWARWNTLDDWRGFCRACGQKRIGSLGEFGKPCPACNGSHEKEGQVPETLDG